MISVLLVAALAYPVAAVVLHPHFIYPFDQTPFAQEGFETVVIPDGDTPVYVASSPRGGPAVLYLMGNAGSLALFPRTLEMHRAAGRHVAALEYPGGGGRAGAPSERALKAQALFAYDWLDAQTEAPIVVHGYSLGTSLALYVASEREPAGVILDAPFARMCEQMARQSRLPACWLPGVQKWDSLALAPDVTAPVLIQHGVADALALVSDGERVAAALADVLFVPVAGATHTSLIDDPDYADRISDFIAEVAE